MKDGEMERKGKQKRNTTHSFHVWKTKNDIRINVFVCVHTHRRAQHRNGYTRTKEESVSSLLLLIGLCGDRWETKRIL